MSALDELFAVLLALYVFESVWCVPAGACLFVARGLGGLRDVRRTWVESGALEFVRAPLLAPWLPQLVALPFPIALAPEGIVAWDGPRKGRVLSAARAARLIAFAPGLSFAADGKTVLTGAAVVARLDSAGAAEASPSPRSSPCWRSRFRSPRTGGGSWSRGRGCSVRGCSRRRP
jgi:hypothetical protein